MFLVGQRAEIATREEVSECVADLKNLLDECTLTERKSFIRSFVNQIEVTDSEVSLNYTIPILPSKIREEKVPVLGIVHYGGPYWTVPELMFEKKELIQELQRFLVDYQKTAK